jgi:superfamily II DNA or RNA helicase
MKDLSLRPYQMSMIEEALRALGSENNSLCIAPTGADKTIIISQIISGHLNTALPGAKVLVLQHTKELLQQNRDKVALWCPHLETSLFHSEEKDTSGCVIFAMVQTLCRNYKKFPPVDLVVIDEAHHAVASSYLKVVNHLKEKNPRLKILGMTATPNRGDRKGLKGLFKGVTAQIHLSDLIADGYLVSPRIFTVDAGQQEDLRSILWRKDKDDPNAMEKFINQQKQWDKANTVLTDNLALNGEVVRHWKEKAVGKKTIVFCSTLRHTQDIRDTFERNGIRATHVNGEMTREERLQALGRFDSKMIGTQLEAEQGNCQEAMVITNAAVLTEGWDFPAIECVILLRPMSYESTYVQMIGRGLRSSPGKKECIILDFGMSSLRHRPFSLEVDLSGKREKDKSLLEVNTLEQEEGRGEDRILSKYSASIPLKELAPHLQSPFLWESFEIPTGTELLMAGGYNQTAFIIKDCKTQDHISLVKAGEDVHHLKTGSFSEALVACEKTMRKMDFWRRNAAWMKNAPSEKQLSLLKRTDHYTQRLNSYQAGLLVSLNLNKRRIQQAAHCQISL